jgi:hypothetical protein
VILELWGQILIEIVGLLNIFKVPFCLDLLLLEDEKVSGQSFQAEQVITVSTNFDLVGDASVLFSYDLILFLNENIYHQTD